MLEDARAYVRKFEERHAVGKMVTEVPEEPWETVCAHLVGPLPRSKHGIQMFLVLINRFSMRTELVPLRIAIAETLQRALRESMVAWLEVPKVLITDNGVKFKKFLLDMGTPSERANRTVKTMIAQFVGKTIGTGTKGGQRLRWLSTEAYASPLDTWLRS